jgi:flagellar protein FlaG
MKISDMATSFIMQKSFPHKDVADSVQNQAPSSVSAGTAVSHEDGAIIRVDQAADTSGLAGYRPGEKKIEMEQVVDQAIEKANQFFQADNRSLQFVKDKDTEHMVILIKDMKTDEVIRQIPSEAMLKLSRQLEQLQGFLFEDKV